jgi:hypothetical protein
LAKLLQSGYMPATVRRTVSSREELGG